jgi:plasmid maintenance system antidote protein VapI
MNYSECLIDALRDKQKLPSDYKAAEVLGITRQMVSNIRAGRRNLSPEQTVRAAKLAGIDPGIALLRRFEETIDDLETRHYLEKITEEIQEVRAVS